MKVNTVNLPYFTIDSHTKFEETSSHIMWCLHSWNWRAEGIKLSNWNTVIRNNVFFAFSSGYKYIFHSIGQQVVTYRLSCVPIHVFQTNINAQQRIYILNDLLLQNFVTLERNKSEEGGQFNRGKVVQNKKILSFWVQTNTFQY